MPGGLLYSAPRAAPAPAQVELYDAASIQAPSFVVTLIEAPSRVAPSNATPFNGPSNIQAPYAAPPFTLPKYSLEPTQVPIPYVTPTATSEVRVAPQAVPVITPSLLPCTAEAPIEAASPVNTGPVSRYLASESSLQLKNWVWLHCW